MENWYAFQMGKSSWAREWGRDRRSGEWERWKIRAAAAVTTIWSQHRSSRLNWRGWSADFSNRVKEKHVKRHGTKSSWWKETSSMWNEWFSSHLLACKICILTENIKLADNLNSLCVLDDMASFLLVLAKNQVGFVSSFFLLPLFSYLWL